MKVLALGASNNRVSINRTLASFAARLIATEVETLHLADYELPLFSDEREQLLGQPRQARAFYRKIAEADALVISFAEHNGSYTAAYKNLFDWVSRIDKAVFQHKPCVFLSTSPGPGGAASVLRDAINSAPYFGTHLLASLSVPSFHDNFDSKARRMTNPALRKRLEGAMGKLSDAVRQSSVTEIP